MDGITLDEQVERIVERVLERRESARTGWLTAAEAADYLGMSVGGLRNAVQQGRLPRNGTKGEKLLFTRRQLDDFVQNRWRR